MALNSLQSVDLIKSDGTLASGLVPVGAADIQDLGIDEQVAIFDAHLIKGINFVFFRRFSDGRSPQIAAYVIDNSDERLDRKALAKIHQQVWLQGKAPLLYVGWPSRIDILSCAKGPDFWKEKNGECECIARRKKLQWRQLIQPARSQANCRGFQRFVWPMEPSGKTPATEN